MKCHFTYYIENGKKHKVLIPGCWQVVLTDDIKRCTCENPLTPYQFEKERFNEIVKKLQDEIRGLIDENKHLMDIIKKKTLTSKTNVMNGIELIAKERGEQLIIAGALIAAELDRLIAIENKINDLK